MTDSMKLAKVGPINANLFIGSFGSVFKIKRKSDGKILCWKELEYGRM